jgi:hypothetical protein
MDERSAENKAGDPFTGSEHGRYVTSPPMM